MFRKLIIENIEFRCMSWKRNPQNVLSEYMYLNHLDWKKKQKKPRPNQNIFATHFWVSTHQLRNANLEHKQL